MTLTRTYDGTLYRVTGTTTELADEIRDSILPTVEPGARPTAVEHVVRVDVDFSTWRAALYYRSHGTVRVVNLAPTTFGWRLENDYLVTLPGPEQVVTTYTPGMSPRDNGPHAQGWHGPTWDTRPTAPEQVDAPAPSDDTCGTCDGRGALRADPWADPRPCPTCYGARRYAAPVPTFAGAVLAVIAPTGALVSEAPYKAPNSLDQARTNYVFSVVAALIEKRSIPHTADPYESDLFAIAAALYKYVTS